MRHYLKIVADSMECVDPQLHHNPGLAARLEDLEDQALVSEPGKNQIWGLRGPSGPFLTKTY